MWFPGEYDDVIGNNANGTLFSERVRDAIIASTGSGDVDVEHAFTFIATDLGYFYIQFSISSGAAGRLEPIVAAGRLCVRWRPRWQQLCAVVQPRGITEFDIEKSNILLAPDDVTAKNSGGAQAVVAVCAAVTMVTLLLGLLVRQRRNQREQAEKRAKESHTVVYSSNSKQDAHAFSPGPGNERWVSIYMHVVAPFCSLIGSSLSFRRRLVPCFLKVDFPYRHGLTPDPQCHRVQSQPCSFLRACLLFPDGTLVRACCFQMASFVLAFGFQLTHSCAPAVSRWLTRARLLFLADSLVRAICFQLASFVRACCFQMAHSPRTVPHLGIDARRRLRIALVLGCERVISNLQRADLMLCE
jgi:hypothetical protein